MRQTLLFFAFLFIMGQAHAQVTIGSGIEPNKGALLDLKENDKSEANSTKGLGLPRVQLTTIYTLEDIDPGLDVDKHIGLTIYVPEEFENSCPGVYVWTGTEWQGLNTDASRIPDIITVTDIDGNSYTAKLFNKKGCKRGTYWFTSNLRTTRYNDGSSLLHPAYFSAAISYVEDYPYDENSTANLHRVKSKSDISTTKVMSYLLNGQEIKVTEDAFVSKFGLQYNYTTVFGSGATENGERLCPEGWKVPRIEEWVGLFEEITGVSGGGSANIAIPYLFESNDLYEPSDAREAFAPDKLNSFGQLDMPHPDANASPYTRVPTNMGGYPTGDKNNSGMNIYPAGLLRMDVIDRAGIPPRGLDCNFGAQAALIEKQNGAIGLITGKKNISGWGDEFRKNGAAANVRCIKVIE
ncbi:FISUMP domain-containing protein [Dysgonomonas sp. Marseille-P4361]|uniref:FISUMP domain-containing protein n=1 Tax=Dysgonomonas sp. Marseille-P4361 TaxID=2161820 RepID=UPI000D562C8F|nr:FISUMP domain-containing protein [Dysgonomonas sp. Marseille-P4361]